MCLITHISDFVKNACHYTKMIVGAISNRQREIGDFHYIFSCLVVIQKTWLDCEEGTIEEFLAKRAQ